MYTSPTRGWLMVKGRREQTGQALIYGLFMLMAGVAALFFLFNIGQLTREKTKLVNTSDAVAYSASLMHARAMNFASYTNRAMVADEIAISQVVSLSSWGRYLVDHGNSALQLGCNPNAYFGVFSEPAAEGMLRYTPICETLGYAASYGILDYANQAIQVIGVATMLAAETSKTIFQNSQLAMMGALPIVRKAVMQDVANANYSNDGTISVDEIPLRDTFYAFDGALIMKYYDGTERLRMRNLVVNIFNKDGFTPSRSWGDTALVPTCVDFQGIHFNYVNRTGGTTPPDTVSMDTWQANDQASYYHQQLQFPKFGLPYCAPQQQTLGTGSQAADTKGDTSVDADDWRYTGIPSYSELSEKALADPDPRAQFAVRVLRNSSQTRTSDARSDIKSTPRLNNYNNAAALDAETGKNVYVGLSASEAFFQRPEKRADGMKELANLFNPYWQVHLIDVPSDVRIAAQALQGAVEP